MHTPSSRLLFVTLALSLGASACQSTHRVPGDDDAMMSTLTQEQRTKIDAARAEYTLRTDELAVARLDLVRARAEVVLARTDRDIAQADVERAKNVVAIAETNSTEDLTSAREALATTTAELPEFDQLVLWRESHVRRSERAETLAEATQALAHAKTDLEKARAFAESDQAASEGIDVPASELQVNDCMTREATARAELAGAERESELAERSYETARTNRPAVE